jgi:hypothetical protein
MTETQMFLAAAVLAFFIAIAIFLGIMKLSGG